MNNFFKNEEKEGEKEFLTADGKKYAGMEFGV